MAHFVSLRSGGRSPAPYDSLNLAFHVGDDPQNVLANRKNLAQALGIYVDQFVTGQQVHSANIKAVAAGARGSGAADYDSALEETDALMTDVPGLCLMVLVADCVPVLLFDPVKKVAAAVHAGWRGTVQEITDKTVLAMKMTYGCDPKNILAGISPSIGPDCYEVGTEVTLQVERNLSRAGELLRQKDGKVFFDLWLANKFQLQAAGVPAENIETAGICVHCQHDRFYSVRAAAGGPTGRFGAGIMIK